MTEESQKILKALEKSGLKKVFDRVEEVFPENSVFLVGGAVRNALLGVKINDLDFSTSLRPSQMIELLKDEPLRLTGLDFGTVTWTVYGCEVEITTFRCDETYENHRKPEEFRFGDSKYEDLKRRDFTVNAMMYSTKQGLYDPFCGRMDIQKQSLKAVGVPSDRFEEDALRVLRLYRFFLNYGFSVEEKTFKASKESISLVKKISKERVFSELKKTVKKPIFKKNIEKLCSEYFSSSFIEKEVSESFEVITEYEVLAILKGIQKQSGIEIYEYLFDKSYRKIYTLYSNLESAESFVEYKTHLLKFVFQNKVSETDAKELWVNAKKFGLQHSKRISDFHPKRLKAEVKDELKALYSGKALGEEILKRELMLSFSLVNDFEAGA